MHLRYASIDVWPGVLRQHRAPSPFSADWRSTLDVLDREAYALGCGDVTIRLAVPDSAIRLDGTLRSDRRPPAHPGVIVVLDTPEHGVLTYATDRYEGRRAESSWHENVRAVALALEALRKIERYGVADRGEQYAGFAALGSGVAMGARPAALTLDEAAAVLAGALDVDAGLVLSDHDCARRCYRRAVRLVHPDQGGTGDHVAMTRLDEAWRLVDNYHKERS